MAASKPIDDPAKQFTKSAFGNSKGANWQNDAWDMLDAVGELRYYVGWRASSCSRVRLVASELDEDTGLPIGSTENTRVQEIVRAIAGGTLGQAALIKRAVECLTVPGETWVAILARDGKEEWYALSREEITTKGKTVVIELPSGDKHEFRNGTDVIFRVWNPHPRKAKEADSPVRASMDPLREIVRTTKTISNASKSRLIGNGIVFVPNQMSLPAADAPTAAGKPTGAPGPIIPGAGASSTAQLQELLYQVAKVAYEDEDSLASLVPMFAGVNADQIQNVKHLRFDNQVTDIAIKTRNDAIARLAMGLDVTPERLLGLGQNSNHWSAWQIGDDDVRLHVSPPIEVVCQALTDRVLRFILEAEGIDPDKYVVWYDASALTADPDLTDEATAAFDRGAITAEAYREFLGLGDSGYDFTTAEGWQIWAQDRVSNEPALITTLAPLLGELIPAEELKPTPAPAIEQAPDEEEPAEDGGTGEEPDTERDAQKASALTRTELAVVELMASRALELAGKRRRTRADYSRLRDIPLHDTHRYMPAVNAADVPKLINGWDSTLEEDVMSALSLDGDRIRAAVRRVVHAELTTTVVDADVAE